MPNGAGTPRDFCPFWGHFHRPNRDIFSVLPDERCKEGVPVRGKSQKSDEEGNEDIAWNFTKFLVDRSGAVVERFGPKAAPEEIAEVLPQYL